LHYPLGVAVAGDGGFLVAEPKNHTVRKVDANGVILHRPKSRRCRSSGVSVFVDQPAEDAGASHPMCV